MYIKRVEARVSDPSGKCSLRRTSPQTNHLQRFPTMFVDPRYEDEAIAALMEEALTEDSEETKFDVEAYFNGNIDY